jgi:peptidyl-prolyl cis-trans isomerase SurA
MLPPSHRLVRLSALAILGVLGVSVAACNRTSSAPAGPAVTADTWAVVNGKPITRQDVDKAYRRSRDAGPTASEEEAIMAKMGLLDDLITQEILLEKAAALKVEVPTTELDTAEANAKKNIPDDVFQQQLTQRGLTAADMRESLRRQLLTDKLIAKEVTEKVHINSQEIADFFNANKAQFNVPEESYHLAQIVITPAPDPQLSNGTGDDAQTPQAAAQKVQMLMQRLKEGASFRDLAAGYSEDSESAARGGDLGLVPMSRLQQAPPQLKAAVLGKQPGSVNLAASNGAYTLVLVVSHEQAGQRDLNTPGIKEQLLESLKQRKEQLLRAAYITAARNDAKVEHYLARRLVEANGVVAGGQPVVRATDTREEMVQSGSGPTCTCKTYRNGAVESRQIPEGAKCGDQICDAATLTK